MIGSSLKGAIVSRLMYLPCICHAEPPFYSYSSSSAPTSRVIASSLGRMPTTSVGGRDLGCLRSKLTLFARIVASFFKPRYRSRPDRKLAEGVCGVCARDQHGARSVLFDGTDRGGRKRDVQTNIVLHGVLLRVLGSEGDRGASVIRNHPIYDDAVNETVEILISGGFSTCT